MGHSGPRPVGEALTETQERIRWLAFKSGYGENFALGRSIREIVMDKIDTSRYPGGKNRNVPVIPENLREIPHDNQAEQALLSCLMIDANAWDQVSSILEDDDFYEMAHREIFRVCRSIAESGHTIDLVTLISQLREMNYLERVGGEEYITRLAEATPGASSVRNYADIVRDRAIKRKILDTVKTVTEEIYSQKHTSSVEVLGMVDRAVSEISKRTVSGSTGPVPVDVVMTETIERIRGFMVNAQNGGNGVTGLSSGFRRLDEMIRGFHEGEMIILAARPSMGKTALGMNFVENAFLNPANHRPVVVFSMEMPAWSLVFRMLSSISGVKMNKLSKGELDQDEMNKLLQAAGIIKQEDRKNMLFIDQQPGLSPADIRVRTRNIVKEHGPVSLILIDYLQIMSFPGYGTDKQQEISAISHSLKAIAMEFKVPVIALSQLNRSVESRTDKRPMNSDLRESGSIEQDADLIMHIYRDEYYHKDSKDKGIAEIIIGKQRNGPIGTVKLLFESEYSRFANFDERYENPELQPRPSDLKNG